MLAKRGKRPRSADLKRALSTTYYALFHWLCRANADALCGLRQRQSEAWVQTYRALDHAKAKRAFKRLQEQQTDGALVALAELFVELQELRHHSDYDPGPCRLSRLGVFALIRRTEAFFESGRRLAPDAVHGLAVRLLLHDRRFP